MINKLLNTFKSRYLLVYRKQDGEVKSYEITRPSLKDSVSNKLENRNNVGFRAFVSQEIKFVTFVTIE